MTRNDQYIPFKKEDLAVGLQVMLTAALTFVVLATNRSVELVKANRELAAILVQSPIDQRAAGRVQEQVQDLSSRQTTSMWITVSMLIGIFSVSYLVRRKGWKTETEMHSIWGITVPLIFGTLFLIIVAAGATQ